MRPKDAWLYAAQWGSALTSGDPGACMYGFDEDCRPQSEEHRKDVLDWMEKCRLLVEKSPEDFDDDELEKIEEFTLFIKHRSTEPDKVEPFIIEISSCGAVGLCYMNGSDLREDSDLVRDLEKCSGGGDIEGPSQYILDAYKPVFRTVRKTSEGYKNVLASAEEKRQVCEHVYFDSESDFSDESNCDLYLVWEAACSMERDFA